VRTSKAQLVPATENGTTTTALVGACGMVLAHRAEDVLAHVAPTPRRLRTLLLVVTITIPLFLVGIVAVLWQLAYWTGCASCSSRR
jgi:hypothetical protein